MARNRMIKPEFWTSDTLAKVSRGARLTFIGLWNHCDDYGVILSSVRRIIGEVYPLDESVSEVDVKNEIDELVSADLLICCHYEGKEYLIVKGWGEHQKVDKPSSRFFIPPSEIERVMNNSRKSRDSLDQSSRSKEKEEREREREREEVVVDESVDPPVPDNLPIPNFDEVKNAWNMFADANGLAQVRELTKQRKAGIKARLNERGFDAEEIFREIQKSSFLRGKNDRGWKVDFDFVFCSPNKWVNIVEGKYRDNGTSGGKLSMEELWNELN